MPAIGPTTPPSIPPSGEPQDTSDASLLSGSPPPAAFDADPGAEVAILAVEEGTQAEASSRSARDADEQLQKREDSAAVQDMREKAGSLRAEALFDAGASLATIGCTDPASGAVAKAGRALGDGLFSASQTGDDAQVKVHESASDQAKYGAQVETDAATDAADFVKAALDYYRGYASTQAETQAAAIHRA